jgi:hybrid cluster-associated redox disulfide protein
MKITKDTTILEALQAHPRSRDIFMKHGLGCIACMGATMESIESGAHMHGMEPDELVEDLNRLVEESSASETPVP